MQAHRTLRTFLAALYWDRSVRAASGGPGAWLNTYPPKTSAGTGYVRIEGMDRDRPVAVHLARGRGKAPLFWALPYDCDAKRHTAEQVAADVALLSVANEAEGIAPVPVASGSPGGMHLWTGCRAGLPFPLVQRIYRAAKRLCPSLDTSLSNPTEALIRPPGAAHRNGGYSTLVAHSVDEAVNLLGPASAPVTAFYRLAVRLESMVAALPPEESEQAATETTGEAGHGGHTVPPSILKRGPRVRRIVQDADGCPRVDAPWRPLGGRALQGLRRTPTRRDDHSAVKHGPARSMALAGWTQAEGLAVVRDPESSPALEYLRSERQADGSRRPRSEEDTARLWGRVWWLAVEDAARMPRRPEDDGHAPHADDVQQAVADLVARMRAAGPRRWARKSGPADAAVLAALALLMQLAGSVDVSANVHRLGVLAGYTGQTASQALWRLIRDGWVTVTAEAERRAGRARRITLATGHECPDDEHHQCAIYQAPHSITPDHPGSDRSGTPRPPAPLRTLLTHQQADLWHDLGHHAARTLWTVQQRQGLTVPEIMAETGYGRRTTLRHLHRFTSLRLLIQGRSRRGEPTYRRTARSPYEAAQDTGSAGRMAAMSVTYRVKQEVMQWWSAEETYRALPYAQRPRRVLADQAVIPGMDPRGRAYPRDENGRPDHARARSIEAERINAAGMLDQAHQLARNGQLLDLPYLTAAEPSSQQSAHRVRRRAVIPSRHRCTYCHAEPGERCTTGGPEARRFGMMNPAVRWHAARIRAARQGTNTTA
ncbi:hypothetical protein [Streptomyces sp. IB2014 011-1]|uniref:zinc finger domain-containing protein n=1 Tax=Streptomyces sp. IB2014 011-1 TaxID=1844478 RepID=UPI000978F8CC|nr:hypothetical protein [Streptomyces sp. IB2014 011-1]ONI48520.1 hypothetical protein STIB_73450 [Streptomyces sp. IB2014 011-1]